MKKLFPLYFVCVIFITLSFSKRPLDASVYSNEAIRYSVERDQSMAKIVLNIDDNLSYEKLYLKRSDNPDRGFKQVKYVKRDSKIFLDKEMIFMDKYPMPDYRDVYYKVVTVDKKGTYRFYPPIKLCKL